MTGKPATHKLRMLGKVQQMLSTKKLHSEMLDGGLLGTWVLHSGNKLYALCPLNRTIY